MSRLFTRASAESINLGDISNAKFEYDQTWTYLTFFRVGTHGATDESSLIAKWDGADQFLIQIDNGSAPVDVQVRTNGVGRIIGGADIINPDVWWLCAVTNDGTGGAGGLKLYIVDMAGDFDAGYNPITGQHPGNAVLTALIEIGARASDAKDYFDGDIAHTAYFNSEFGTTKIQAYVHSPTKVAVAESSGCIFYLPLGLGSPEMDLSGNQNNGTLTGTSVSSMPPTGLMTPIRATMPVIEEAGVAGNPWNYYAQMQ